MRRALLLALVLAAAVRTDDFYLSEEEDAQLNEETSQSDFIKQFTCLVATQRGLNARAETWQRVQAEPLFATNFKRLKARMFSACMRDVAQDIVSAVQAAQSAKDFDSIDFSVVNQVDFAEVLDEKEPKLSADDLRFYKQFIKVEEQVREMQKKHKRDNPDAGDESEEEETWDSIRKSKEPPSLAGFGLSSKPLVIAVLVGLGALGLVVAKLSGALFAEEKKPRKKERKAKL